MKDVQVGSVRFATIVVLGLLANAMPGYLRPTAAETVRDACTHDAFRLCSNTIPNVGRRVDPGSFTPSPSQIRT
jgi:hypothetical protein